MSFQIHSIEAEKFQGYFSMNEAELINRDARIVVSDADIGFPCRVSLEDAHKGERLLLVNFEHQSGATPYRARHAIFVKEHARRATLAVGEVPIMLRSRLLSLRAFDDQHMLRMADVVEGEALETGINAMFENEFLSYIQIHFAKPGCFAANVSRASK